MDKLWAPWRIKYVQGKKKKGCIFCAGKKTPDKNYVFIKNKYSLAMLNIYPYNNGHVMVAPLKHTSKIALLKDEERIELFKTLDQSMRRLNIVLKAQGYNIGINISDFAGAGIAGHLHIHIVPRWKGDTNFMPVIYNTKVISQSLKELLVRLKSAKTKRD